jgi:hypothetical protein
MQELILLNNHYLQSMPCLKAFIIPAESCIFKWNGYKYLNLRLRAQIGLLKIMNSRS